MNEVFGIYRESEKESKLIRQIHILFQRRFGSVSSVHFQALMMKKLSYKDYNELIITRDNGTVQSHDKEESKSNSAINANSDAHTLTHDQIIKSPFNKNNVATIKTNKILTRSYYLALSNSRSFTILQPCRIL